MNRRRLGRWIRRRSAALVLIPALAGGLAGDAAATSAAADTGLVLKGRTESVSPGLSAAQLGRIRRGLMMGFGAIFNALPPPNEQASAALAESSNKLREALDELKTESSVTDFTSRSRPTGCGWTSEARACWRV